MMKQFSLLLTLMLTTGCQTATKLKDKKTDVVSQKLTPSAVVAESGAHEWRELDPENTLYLQLHQGQVIIELMPLMAPEHVKNTKALVRQGVFDDTQFYRVIDGFVAQGGPMFEAEDAKPELTYGHYSVSSELTSSADLGSDYVKLDERDRYADETGFYHSFAVGKDNETGESWLLHCYGALGMGRANELDSGGTELYIVNGTAQRYLDRNVTIFGRVVAGMENIQALKRSQNLQGPVDLMGTNVIESIRVASDVPVADRTAIEIMDSTSYSFKKFLAARKNRTAAWFVHQANYIDTCAVPVPVRLKKQ